MRGQEASSGTAGSSAEPSLKKTKTQTGKKNQNPATVVLSVVTLHSTP